MCVCVCYVYSIFCELQEKFESVFDKSFGVKISNIP
jgi:hypothetical protein